MAKTGNFNKSDLTLAQKVAYYKYMMCYPGCNDPTKEDIETNNLIKGNKEKTKNDTKITKSDLK